jgi:hypothetical protein
MQLTCWRIEVSQNVRTFIIFVSVLFTAAFWLPLSNSPRIGPNGGTITETYFGVLRYATMQAVMKEPDFTMTWTLDPKRLVLSIVVTVIFWAGVIWWLRRKQRH